MLYFTLPDHHLLSVLSRPVRQMQESFAIEYRLIERQLRGSERREQFLRSVVGGAVRRFACPMLRVYDSAHLAVQFFRAVSAQYRYRFADMIAKRLQQALAELPKRCYGCLVRAVLNLADRSRIAVNQLFQVEVFR